MTNTRIKSAVWRRGIPLLLTIALCGVFAGCAAPAPGIRDWSGRWVSDDPAGFSFELDKDGTCHMFDADDTLVSWGTYTATESGISFTLDTGSFTWVWRDDAMEFEANGTIHRYRRTD